jgi:hypothetical protein
MFSNIKRIGLVLGTAVALVGLAAPSAFASGNITPANTAFTATNSGNVTFKGSIIGINITVTCTSSSISGTTPASGLTLNLSGPPSFSGCRDSFGGTDTVTTSGTWGLVANGTGSQLSLTVPSGGVKFKSSFLSGCTITAGGATINAAYDNVSKATFTNQSVPASGSGCSAGSTATVNATYITSPGISVM